MKVIYLQWFAKELSEALIVKVRGVLGGDEGDLEGITVESYHGIRTNHEWLVGEEVWSIFVG